MKVSLSRLAPLALGALAAAALGTAVAGAGTTHSTADIRDGGTLTIGLAEEPDAPDSSQPQPRDSLELGGCGRQRPRERAVAAAR